MRLLVTRPEPDASHQAELLAARGHEPVLAPLLAIRSATDVPLELDGAQALIVTSRNALRALASHRDLPAALQLPLFAVGEATAQAAAELGFAKVTCGPGTATTLGPLIAGELSPKSGALVHLSGETVAFDLKSALEAQGFIVRQPILYRAVPATRLPDEALASLNAGRLDGVILMSPRTAAIFAALVVRQGSVTQASRLDCYCLSAAVAQAVEPLKSRAIVAERPREEELLALIELRGGILVRNASNHGRAATDVMADTLGDQHQDGGSGKRPAPTIEGTATEVSVDPAPDETVSPDVDAEAAKSDAEEVAAKRPKGPPPRTSPTELKGFVTHLAAGLLGGLIGVMALALAWNKLPVRQAAAPDLKPLESRLSKLEAAPAPTTDAEALASLGTRVKTLEERKVETPPDLSDLTDRVTRLEESLNALAEPAKDGGSVPDAAVLDARIGDLEQKLQGKIDSALAAQQAASATDVADLKKEVGALNAKLGALAEAHLGGDTSDLAPEINTLDQRISKLEAALPQLSSALDRSAATAKSGAAAIAFANLRNAVAAGRPYAAELAALRSLLSDTGDLGVLPAHAETGIPTMSALVANFETIAQASAAPAPPPEHASLLDSMMASAKSAISIRRIGADVTGDEPAAALARAEAPLKQGELPPAIKEVESLPAPSRGAFAGWLDDAKARLSASDSLTKLESTVLSSLGGGAGTEAKP